MDTDFARPVAPVEMTPEAKPRERMLPATVTIVDDDADYREFLAQHLRQQGVRVRTFGDSNHLLADADPFGDAFYIIDLMLPGVGGEELIRILRLRSEAGVLVEGGVVARETLCERLGRTPARDLCASRSAVGGQLGQDRHRDLGRRAGAVLDAHRAVQAVSSAAVRPKCSARRCLRLAWFTREPMAPT
jgi:CheY-like chemotaxis protein